MTFLTLCICTQSFWLNKYPEVEVSIYIFYINLLFEKSGDLLYNGLNFNVFNIRSLHSFPFVFVAVATYM